MGFRFKQFEVEHDRCAQKVGTDGVLLGSWTPIAQAKRILDIGAGSGLVALMLAQRSDLLCHIDAIEIEPNAAQQASWNFSQSPWAERLHLYEGDFKTFDLNGLQYDLIVSNPPYFNNSLRSEQNQAVLARHDDSLGLDELIKKAVLLLMPAGRIALIIPYDRYEYLQGVAAQYELNIQSQLLVRGSVNSPIKRVLVELTNASVESVKTKEMFIEYARHSYSEEYKQMTQDFYL